MWKKAYFDTRAKIEASGREARWEFDRKRLFERTDYMATICQDLYDILQVRRPSAGSLMLAGGSSWDLPAARQLDALLTLVSSYPRNCFACELTADEVCGRRTSGGSGAPPQGSGVGSLPSAPHSRTRSPLAPPPPPPCLPNSFESSSSSESQSLCVLVHAVSEKNHARSPFSPQAGMPRIPVARAAWIKALAGGRPGRSSPAGGSSGGRRRVPPGWPGLGSGHRGLCRSLLQL